MTIHFTKYYGFSVKRMSGSNDKMYLSFVVWFRRSANRLGYFYPSIRWI